MTDNLPTNWQQQMENEAKALARSFRPTTAQISTKSGVLSYMGQSVPNNKLDVVILAAIFENNYFEGKYDPRNPRNPICFAFGKPQPDGSQPEMTPPPSVVAPQRQSATCDRCDWSQWASDPESPSGKGKRCKEIYKLGVVPAGDYNTTEMAILRVPVTSRKNFEVYVNGVAAQCGRPPWGVVTEISLKPHQVKQFEVVFTTKAVLPEADLGKVWPKIDGAFEAMMEPYDPNSNPLEAKAPASDKKRKY
jgi:hypothetical protein